MEKTRKSRGRIIALSACAGVATVLIAIAATVGGGDHKAEVKPKASNKISTKASSPGPTGTAALLEWYTEVSPSLTKFQADLTKVSGGDSLPSVSLCTDLRDDVKDIQKTPIPDENTLAHNAWNRGMDYYEIAFEACRDQDYLGMSSALSKGTEQVNQVVEAIQAY